jgi:hypothetical protein
VTRRRKAERALYEAAPWCARCCRTDVELHGHERLGRAQGGNPNRPDCLLCNRCNTWCEDQPILAALTGWKVSRKHGRYSRLREDEAIDLNGDIIRFGAVS